MLAAWLALAPVANASDDATAPVSVTVERTRISTALGRRFEFRSTVSNRSSRPARGLIAHLNVLSLRNGIYVDPEDWSSQRTRYLGTLQPDTSRTITWRMQAVNHGTFGVYVAVLNETGSARPPTTAPTIRLAVAERQTLNAGGIVPLAAGMPAFLGLLTVGFWLRRRG
jgi:hypothetical protein